MSELTNEEFLTHVQNHVMTINNDSGVYRNILFKRPDSSDMHFHITTWDGHLCISGDMGTYVFSRVHDMFRFFRDCRVNLGYWAEKIKAGEYKQFSPNAAREALNAEFENWKEDTDADQEFIDEEKENLDFIDTDDEFEFTVAIRNWEPNEGGVQLNDFWEHSLNGYTRHYMWCCHAIVWAIAQYDASKDGAL